MQAENNIEWTEIINSRRRWYDLRLKELWKYRDLIMIFVRRDFVSVYKQTVLGPLWFLLQPLLTTIVFTVFFGKIAHLSTSEVPATIFYMTGITAWNYFASCLNKTSGTFINNASVFGKVYFPRLTVPVSIVISSLITFGIQFLFLLCFWFFFYFIGASVQMNIYVLLIPVLVLMMALMGLGFGIVISSLSTKYKDIQYLVAFGVQLLMFATPVIYPLRDVPEGYRIFVMLNPMSSIIEIFKYSLLDIGTCSWPMLAYSAGFTFFILLTGVILFNKTEQRFIDTI